MTTQPPDLTCPDVRKKLREVAERATPGPWYPMPCDDERFMCMSAVSAVPVPNENNDQYSDHDPNDMIAILYHQCLPAVRPDDHETAYDNAEFVATFNPQTILALLDAYEASARDAERYRWLKRQKSKEELLEFVLCKEGTDQAIDAARHATQGD